MELTSVEAAGRLLWKRDVAPYQYLINKKIVDSIMTAHVLYPQWDSQNMATLSHKIIGEKLRGTLNYKGVIVSDDLHMRAIKDAYTLPEACMRFFSIGGDLVLICRYPEEQIEAFKSLEKIIKNSPGIEKSLLASKKRLQSLKKNIVGLKKVPMDVLGNASHHAVLSKLYN